MSDAAGIITALATLVAAIGGVLATVIGLRNTRAIKEVHDATNGMKHELVSEVRAASLAKGRKEGAAEERAETHRRDDKR